MVRLTEIRLPLDHPPEALRAAVLERLGVADAQLRRMVVFRRAVDARRKAAIKLTYTIDVELAAGITPAEHRHTGVTPDMAYLVPKV